MPIEKLRPSYNFTEDRMKELEQVIPEAFSDGKINWQRLKEAMGQFVEDGEEPVEHFGLTWPGKREARQLASIPSMGTLAPKLGDGIDENLTSNIFIEGDNLEILKIIHKSYNRKIKLIFIDPPYNTGSDFIYKDNFTEPLRSYLESIGNIDRQGNILSTNTQADGRFHSKWLSMIFPRIILSKALLRDDGVIFITIDDNEYHHLKLIMDEVFGQENHIATIVWQSRDTPGNDTTRISSTHNYVVCYRKSDSFKINLLPRTQDQIQNYKNPDNDPRGPWLGTPLTRSEYRERDYYPLTNPSGIEVWPTEGNSWRRPKEMIAKLESDNRIWWGIDGTSTFPFIKQFLSEVKEGVVPQTWWDYKFGGSTRRARKEMKSLFGGQRGFDTPKPLDLIDKILTIATTNNGEDIVLDFFAGSSTTAHGVLKKNTEDDGNRKFIMIQIPEKTDSEEFKTIAEISKERIRRAIQQIRSNQDGQINMVTESTDLGFKVFELVESNFTQWKHIDDPTSANIGPIFDEIESPLVQKWNPQILMIEILLNEGFPLDSQIKWIDDHPSNQIYQIISRFHDHYLYICLDERIDSNVVHSLKIREADVFITLDSALSDETKMRLADKFNLHVI
jgi:adenine-specific DNA-methyltransferase